MYVTGAPEAPGETAPLALLRATDAFMRTLRETGATLARDVDCSRATLAIVRLLDFHGSMQVGDLAQHMRVDISVASRQVGDLVATGLVERVVGEDDRRARRLQLTDAGRTRARELAAALAERTTVMFAGWSDEELRTATAVLDRLTATVGAEAPPTPAANPAPPRGRVLTN